MLETLNCPACGAPVNVTVDSPVTRCPYCHNNIVIPVETQKSSSSGLPEQIEGLKEVARLADDGNYIDAIKKYRQLTNAPLKEAKEAVDAYQSGKPLEVVTTSSSRVVFQTIDENAYSSGDIDPATLNQILKLSRQGKKIEAIKLFRETFNVSLATAKEAVETLSATGPNLQPDTGQENKDQRQAPIPYPQTPSAIQPDRKTNTSALILLSMFIVIGLGVLAFLILILLF